MTVSSTSSRTTFAGNATTTSFATSPMIFYDTSDLIVYVTDDDAGTSQTLTENTHYTVTGGDGSTGTVNLAGGASPYGAPAVGYTLVIDREIAATQGADLVNNDSSDAEVQETALDRLTLICQQLATKVGRALRIGADNVTVTDTELPIATGGSAIGWNASGTSLINIILSTGTTLANLAASSGASLVGFLQNGLGAVLRTLQDKGTDSMSALDYGIVPDDSSAGVQAANAVALRKLICDEADGGTSDYVGPVSFPWGFTYYFNNTVEGMFDVRPGVRLDLCGSTLAFTKTRVTADNGRGFFNLLRDSDIENGVITVNYNGTGGTGAGSVIRIGSRNGYPFGTYTAGVNDEDLTTPQGNINVKGLRVSTNNPTSHIILALGGLDGLYMKNVFLDGQSVAPVGFYYEFGFWHRGAAAADHQSSHGHNMHFKNIHVNDILNSNPNTGVAFSLVGAYGAEINGLYVDGAYDGLVVRSGEALFYNVGTPDTGIKPHVSARNVNTINCTGTGVTFQGAESAVGGYLADVIAALTPAAAQYAAQTDLISFSLDGFSIDADVAGLFLNGPFTLKNGSAHGVTSESQLKIGDEAFPFYVENVRVLNSGVHGIYAGIGGATAIWSPARLKYGEIHSSTIAGSNDSGINIGSSESVLISRCRIGYNTAYDAAAETTQDYGVQVIASGKGVVVDGCFVSTSGGAVAYRLEGTGNRGCDIRNPRGTVTSSGNWDRNGVGTATATELGLSTSWVNTENKYAYRRVFETSTSKLMVALGSGATDNWEVADGSAAVTPAP